MDKDDNSITRYLLFAETLLCPLFCGLCCVFETKAVFSLLFLRSNEYVQKLFKESGLVMLKEQLQLEFPPGMLPVRMYALQ